MRKQQEEHRKTVTPDFTQTECQKNTRKFRRYSSCTSESSSTRCDSFCSDAGLDTSIDRESVADEINKSFLNHSVDSGLDVPFILSQAEHINAKISDVQNNNNLVTVSSSSEGSKCQSVQRSSSSNSKNTQSSVPLSGLSEDSQSTSSNPGTVTVLSDNSQRTMRCSGTVTPCLTDNSPRLRRNSGTPCLAENSPKIKRNSGTVTPCLSDTSQRIRRSSGTVTPVALTSSLNEQLAAARKPLHLQQKRILPKGNDGNDVTKQSPVRNPTSNPIRCVIGQPQQTAQQILLMSPSPGGQQQQHVVLVPSVVQPHNQQVIVPPVLQPQNQQIMVPPVVQSQNQQVIVAPVVQSQNQQVTVASVVQSQNQQTAVSPVVQSQSKQVNAPAVLQSPDQQVIASAALQQQNQQVLFAPQHQQSQEAKATVPVPVSAVAQPTQQLVQNQMKPPEKAANIVFQMPAQTGGQLGHIVYYVQGSPDGLRLPFVTQPSQPRLLIPGSNLIATMPTTSSKVTTPQIQLVTTQSNSKMKIALQPLPKKNVNSKPAAKTVSDLLYEKYGHRPQMDCGASLVQEETRPISKILKEVDQKRNEAKQILAATLSNATNLTKPVIVPQDKENNTVVVTSVTKTDLNIANSVPNEIRNQENKSDIPKNELNATSELQILANNVPKSENLAVPSEMAFNRISSATRLSSSCSVMSDLDATLGEAPLSLQQPLEEQRGLTEADFDSGKSNSDSVDVDVSNLEQDALLEFLGDEGAPDLADITPSILQIMNTQDAESLTDDFGKYTKLKRKKSSVNIPVESKPAQLNNDAYQLQKPSSVTDHVKDHNVPNLMNSAWRPNSVMREQQTTPSPTCVAMQHPTPVGRGQTPAYPDIDENTNGSLSSTSEISDFGTSPLPILSPKKISVNAKQVGLTKQYSHKSSSGFGQTNSFLPIQDHNQAAFITPNVFPFRPIAKAPSSSGENEINSNRPQFTFVPNQINVNTPPYQKNPPSYQDAIKHTLHSQNTKTVDSSKSNFPDVTNIKPVKRSLSQRGNTPKRQKQQKTEQQKNKPQVLPKNAPESPFSPEIQAILANRQGIINMNSNDVPISHRSQSVPVNWTTKLGHNQMLTQLLHEKLRNGAGQINQDYSAKRNITQLLNTPSPQQFQNTLPNDPAFTPPLSGNPTPVTLFEQSSINMLNGVVPGQAQQMEGNTYSIESVTTK